MDITGKVHHRVSISNSDSRPYSAHLRSSFRDPHDDTPPMLVPHTRRLRWYSRAGSRTGPRDPGLKKPWIPGTDLGQGQISQIYSNRLKFFVVTRSSSTCHDRCFPQSFGRIFEEGKKSFSESTLQGFPGVREMWDARESLLPAPNYNTPVKDLTYKDLLTHLHPSQSRSV